MKPKNRTWAPKGVTLDPREAIHMTLAELVNMFGGEASGFDDFVVHMPRVPLDKAEARAMIETWTMPNPQNPGGKIRTYIGYTDTELLRVKAG